MDGAGKVRRYRRYRRYGGRGRGVWGRENAAKCELHGDQDL